MGPRSSAEDAAEEPEDCDDAVAPKPAVKGKASAKGKAPAAPKAPKASKTPKKARAWSALASEDEAYPAARVHWWRIVCDESHNIKDPSTMANKACCKLSVSSPLSGSHPPFPSTRVFLCARERFGLKL